ncbi:hypothetical protein [Salibacterium halotolerans]|uniref:ABC-2 type transport system permease protein n=1 Tax=Salibacterium halotolerans TaxID=1884432 RepID=A0A1I5RT31_9BACI|nr:hypothetical protein [Salibacterium halotolerans]SFP61421.1 ABC-2 type transport system permease protein [Salibacterium halotolerans]
MKSKVSFFNPGIQKQNFKQHGWIGIVMLVGWLFVLPLRMIMIGENMNNDYRIDVVYDISQGLQFPLIAGLSIAAGIFFFRYLQLPDAADMMHSLPVKRVSLYFNHIISGIIMLAAPVLITSTVVYFTAEMYPHFNNLSIGDLWSWAAKSIIMSLFFFLFTVFVSMATGISAATGILTIILLLLPLGMYTLTVENMSPYLYGFPSGYTSTEMIVPWSPLIFLSVINELDVMTKVMAGYTVAVVVFGTAALVLYKYRAVESASEAITFTVLRPIFKYGVTFCVMLAFGIYYMQYNSIGWLIFGYIFGSVVGLLIAEMILKKTWRVFRLRLLAGYAGYAAVILFLGLLLRYDAFGYESAIPDSEAVEGVYFGESLSSLPGTGTLIASYEKELSRKNLYSGSESYINSVQQLHEAILEERPTEETISGESVRSVSIAYKLENGRKVVRWYDNVPKETFQDELRAVMEHDAYTMQHFNLNMLQQPMTSITISNPSGGYEPVSITEPQQVQELKDILISEYSTMTYEALNNLDERWGYIYFNPEKQPDTGSLESRYPYHKSFDEISQWLQTNGYIENIRPTMQQVSSMQVADVRNLNMDNDTPRNIFSNNMEGLDTADVTSEEARQMIMNHFTREERGNYVVRIQLNNNQTVHGYIEQEDLPESLRTSFE